MSLSREVCFCEDLLLESRWDNLLQEADRWLVHLESLQLPLHLVSGEAARTDVRLWLQGLDSVPGPPCPRGSWRSCSIPLSLFPHLRWRLVILRIEGNPSLKHVLLVLAPMSIRSMAGGCHHSFCAITCHVYQAGEVGRSPGMGSEKTWF